MVLINFSLNERHSHLAGRHFFQASYAALGSFLSQSWAWACISLQYGLTVVRDSTAASYHRRFITLMRRNKYRNMIKVIFKVFDSTLFFLLVGEGGFMSFCKIRRHIRVMFSTTTGVFILTAIRNRLRAVDSKKGCFSDSSINELTISSVQLKRCLLKYISSGILAVHYYSAIMRALTTAEPQLPTTSFLRYGVSEEQHFILQTTDLYERGGGIDTTITNNFSSKC